jgi:polysaccharide biosynthesis/export protein
MLARRRILALFFSASLLSMGQASRDPASKTFSVAGKVKRPGGRYELRDGMRIVDAIVTAGGFADYADQTRVAVVRGKQRHILNYREFLRGKNVEDNILLEDGDVIYVP